MEIDKELMIKIYDLRRRLHSIPEASMHEMRTKAMLMSFLRENTDLEIVDRGAWFYAVLKSSYDIIGDEERTPIAFRADMDAVCGQDGKPGHYCGHDGHSSILCGAAAWLSLSYVSQAPLMRMQMFHLSSAHDFSDIPVCYEVHKSHLYSSQL